MSEDVIMADDQNTVAAADDDIIVSTPFDYDALEMETRIVVQQRTRDIKERMKRTAQDIIDTGRDLAEVRSKLNYGQLGHWLASEFAWSRSTAYNLIRVHEQLGSANFAQLPVAASALYLLAAPSTPPAAREEALQRAGAGEAISRGTAKEIVTSHKSAPATSRSGGGSGGGGGGAAQARSAPASAAPAPSAAAPATPVDAPAPSPAVEVSAAPAALTNPIEAEGEGDGDSEEIAALPTAAPVAQPTQAEPSPAPAAASPALTPLPAAPPPMLSVVASGMQAQQIRLLAALELLLDEARQQVQRQLAELSSTGADVPAYTANPDLLRQSARQLVESPALRAAGAMLALGLRGPEGERQVSNAA